MSDYTKATNFASKDSLPVGDANKKVKGIEIDNEFNAISNSISTKANLQSPEFTGIPTAPTATASTNTTQIATTAFVTAALQALYPVGTIYTSTSATNPASTFGFGTWEAFGAGKVLVGQDTGDTSFDVLEETGGSKDAVVVSHTHSITDPGHKHTHPVIDDHDGDSGDIRANNGGNNTTTVNNVDTSTATTGISIASAGESGTNKNLQPYVVVKMWKRTA